MAYFLGIFGGQGPNPAATLLLDGETVAFGEEERFSRIKNAPSALPIASIMFCLKQAGITLADVDRIGFAWDCPHYAKAAPELFADIAARYPDCDNTYNQIHEARLLAGFNPDRIKADLRFALAKNGETLDTSKLAFLKHHLCHAASTYFASGFDEASVLTLDGSGEEFTTFLWHAKGTDITDLEHFNVPDSLGGYYATFTEYLGFKSDSEEGKLMGLAPYGAYCEETQKKLDRVLDYDRETGAFSVALNMRFFGTRSYSNKFTDELVDLFGPPRFRGEPIDERHKTIAFNVQWRLEQIAALLARRLVKTTGSSRLCLAGGVAMNCKMNGVLAALPEVSEIFVQPASSDNGVSLGAAMLCARDAGITRFEPMKHCYLGPEFDGETIEAALKEAKVAYHRSNDICAEVAEALSGGKIVGWFQGRSEIGARALGNRSILASPLIEDMREKLNREVKHRELWRPFCPSLTVESYDRYFGNAAKSDFMILAFPVIKEYHDLIPAAVHVDGTARPQTVRADTNPRFHKLLSAFGDLSGHPVLINTSFNIQGEPIVDTPEHALRCFGGTGIDILALGDFIVEKPNAA